MKVVRIETEDLNFGKMIATKVTSFFASLGHDTSKIVATPERCEDGLGICEIYFDIPDGVDEGLVISVKSFDVKNSEYDLLLHESELFGGNNE